MTIRTRETEEYKILRRKGRGIDEKERKKKKDKIRWRIRRK